MPAGVATVMILSTYPHFRMVRRPVCAHLRMRKRGKVALTVSECEMCGQARPALLVGGEADGVEQPGATPAGRWAGGLWFGGLLGPRGDVGDDLLGHPVQQRQRTGHHPAGLVDVLDPGPDELGVADDRPHDVRALLEVGGDSGEQRANPVEVERQPGDQQHDVDDRENDHPGHDFTFPSTRPRNRWCLRPSPRTRSTPSATCGISAVSAVFAAAAFSVSRTCTTRRSMIFTSTMSTVSRAATAITTTRPRMLAVSHRLCSVEDIATLCIVITQPCAAAL